MKAAEVGAARAVVGVVSEVGQATQRLVRWLADWAAQLAGSTSPSSGPQVRRGDPAETKFFLGADGSGRQAHSERSAAELPRGYGRDRIALLPRDPAWLFAFWEVTPESRINALRGLGLEGEGTREILRVYETDDTGRRMEPVMDVELAPGADTWHIEVSRPGRAFVVEVGLRTGEGRFVPLARSNVATTPPQAQSPDASVDWVELRPHGAPVGTSAAWNGVRVEPRSDAATATSPGGSSEHVPRT